MVVEVASFTSILLYLEEESTTTSETSETLVMVASVKVEVAESSLYFLVFIY